MLLSSLDGVARSKHRGGEGNPGWHCLPSFGEQKLMGMKCTGIKSGSILYRAGVRDGDVVTSIDGAPTLSPRDMMRALRDLKAADRADLTVLRGGKTQTLSYTK